MNLKSTAFASLIIAQLATFASISIDASQNSNELLEMYASVCQAEVKVAQRETQIQQFRLQAVKQLHSKGFASWMELQRTQLKYNAATARQKQLAEFNQFVGEVHNEVSTNQYQLNDPGAAIKVFLPGSNRLIGWMNYSQPIQIENDSQIKDAELEFALSKRNFENFTTKLATAQAKRSGQADQSWFKKLNLSTDLAAAKFEFAKAKFEYIQQLHRQISSSKPTSTILRRTVKPESNTRFGNMVFEVADAEANSQGDIERIQIQLDRESQRLMSIKSLAIQGYATVGEIEQLETHVAQLQTAIDGAKLNRQNLIAAVDSLKIFPGGSEPNSIGKSTVSKWPVEVFSDANWIQYLIEQRRALHIQSAKLEMAKQSLALNKTILERIVAAAQKLTSNSVMHGDRQFESLLKEGQEKEIAGYRWKITALKADIAAAADKIKILAMEENRFLNQAQIMAVASEVAAEHVDSETVSLEMEPALLNSMVSTGLKSSDSSSAKSTQKVHFAYVESNLADTLGYDANLVMLQTFGFPLGRFEDDDDLLRPVQLIDYSRRMSYTPSRSYMLRVGPNYTGTLYRNQYRYGYNPNSNRSIAAPSLYNSPYATDAYRRNQVKSNRKFERAYPFGILRSDLRRFATPGQPPWYIPGSPNNLRHNQLRTERLSPNGQTGNQILKSKNYLDLTRPDLGGY